MKNIESITDIVAALQEIENEQTYDKVAELLKDIREVEDSDLTYKDKFLNLAIEHAELEERNEEINEWYDELREEYFEYMTSVESEEN